MSISQKEFGHNGAGLPVTQYTLTNASGASVSVLDYGGVITSIIVPDREGHLADVCLGFDRMDPYLGKNGSMGALIGRYGNRISKGRFTIDGKTYSLYINNGENHLHGGKEGFGVRMWQARPLPGQGSDSLSLRLVSRHMEENYPGNLNVTVTYTFDDSGSLSIHYEAQTDQATHVNLTNHAYFNLAGHNAGPIADHLIKVEADAITKVDPALIPTGEMLPVAGTPFDFRRERRLGDGLQRIGESAQMTYGGGYDHNFVLRKGLNLGLAARLRDPASGRYLEVVTDQPGVQVYTANTAGYGPGKDGAHYGPFCGICLETQHYPDTPNHDSFPSTLLRPGEKYDTLTIYAFRAE